MSISARPKQREISPEAIAKYGLRVDEIMPTCLPSTVKYSDDLGFYTQYERYRYSELQGFLVNNVAFKPLTDISFPHQPGNGLFLASRRDRPDQDTYFYSAQLEHRGIPTTKSQEVAKIRLFLAPDNASLDSDLEWTRDELMIRLQHADKDPNYHRRFIPGEDRPVQAPPVSSFFRRLYEQPTSLTNNAISDLATKKLQELDKQLSPNKTINNPALILGRYNLVCYGLNTSERTVGQWKSTCEVVITLWQPTRQLYGRYRMNTKHGVFTLPLPSSFSTKSRACSIAFEDFTGVWHLADEEGASIAFLSSELIVLGPAFRGGLSKDKKGSSGEELFGVRESCRDFGFVSTYFARLDGMERPGLFKRMWEAVKDEASK
ncbi:uncharacterized protein HMPREF1541_11012 [Cyphellophora europaea CBS 101466]|uniref:Uncharacterized protein n=1 Tax=Cyphellophora europaea (strain CBS 101466) TaxID=1220924 RepID=W2S5C0_CYPE1|nr:uncharacterized protein HMPREF1541_11012 [Cyphellophora europaea CBS 101466]ETN43881.1 hypothetical protein HMPREF1541_11012 [Cyphellophora europaea CBS 101466]